MFSPQQAQTLRKNQIFVQPAHSQQAVPQLGCLHLPSGLSSALDQIHGGHNYFSSLQAIASFGAIQSQEVIIKSLKT